MCGRHAILEVKLYYPDSRVTVCQNVCSVCVVQLRNKLPEEVVSASSVSAFISHLMSMHVSFLMFCFSAVCFFIYVSIRAVVFSGPFCPVDTVSLFTVFTVLYLC